MAITPRLRRRSSAAISCSLTGGSPSERFWIFCSGTAAATHGVAQAEFA